MEMKAPPLLVFRAWGQPLALQTVLGEHTNNSASVQIL